MRKSAKTFRLVCLASTFCLTACASYTGGRLDSPECAYADNPIYTGANDQILASVDLQGMTDALAMSLCNGDQVQSLRDNPDDVLLVPDFVDLNLLNPGSLGLLLGERFRASVSKVCKLPIRQVELSREIRLTPSGLLALTRDSSTVRYRQFGASSIMIGTFDLQPGRLTLVARQVSIEGAVINRMATKETTWRCDRSFLTGRSSLKKNLQ